MNDLIYEIKEKLSKHGNLESAQKMAVYMKDRFPFYGVNSPLRKEIFKSMKQNFSQKNPSELMSAVKTLWEENERECHYIGIELLCTFAKKFDASFLPDIEKLLITHSWWDSIDPLSVNLVGVILRKDQKLREKWVTKWTNSPNIWLNRTAILHQLKYRNDVDIDLLMSSILTHDKSKEFFIRKAQGWMLREYSKKNPVWVRDFLDSSPQLSGLTHREASKYI